MGGEDPYHGHTVSRGGIENLGDTVGRIHEQCFAGMTRSPIR